MHQAYLPLGTIIPIPTTENCLEYCNGFHVASPAFPVYNSYPSNSSQKLWCISISETINWFLLLTAPNRSTHSSLCSVTPTHFFSVVPFKPGKATLCPLAFLRVLCLYESPYAVMSLSNVFPSLDVLCLL